MGCQQKRFDRSKVSMRPRIFLEGASPIPLFDEYDIKGIQMGTVDNILSQDESDRVYAIWLSLDRRSAFHLQKETVRHLGKRFQLVIDGQIIGVHPIEKSVSNGILPFILSTQLNDSGAQYLYTQLSQSIFNLQSELEISK